MEVVGGILIVALIVGAIVMLRNRPTAPTDNAVALATPNALAAPVQIALGGTATPIPTFTFTPIPPTATTPPTSTPTPDGSQLTPPPGTPAPQTGGSPTVNRQSYIIAEGDTLLGIAIRFNVTLEDLLRANNFSNANVMIHPGDAIHLPSNSDTAAADAAAATQPPPAPTNAPAQDKPTDAPANQPAPQQPQVVGRQIYVVKAGDSLWTISQRLGLSVDDLMAYNGFQPNNYSLGIGQEIVINPGVTTTPVPPTATPVPPTATPVPPTATPKPTYTAAPSPTVQPTAIALAPTPTTEAGAGASSAGAEKSGNAASGPADGSAAPAPASTASSDAVAATKYPAPVLLGTTNQSAIQGKATPLLLNWTSVGILSPDEYYVVRVTTMRDGKPYTEEAWVKATGWRVSDSLRPSDKSTDAATYTWDVTVRKCDTRGPDGQPKSGPAISPTSETYKFTWTP